MPELPRISGSEAVRVFGLLGFRNVRQRGSHVVLRRGDSGCARRRDCGLPPGLPGLPLPPGLPVPRGASVPASRHWCGGGVPAAEKTVAARRGSGI